MVTDRILEMEKRFDMASKQLRRAGAVFFHNSVLLIKMHTSKIGNTLYTEPFWKGACCS